MIQNKIGLIEVIAIFATIFFIGLAFILAIAVNRQGIYENYQEISAGEFGDEREFVTVREQELEGNKGYCVDSDDSYGDIISQSFISGLALYFYNACGSDINLLSGNYNSQCSFILSASDICENQDKLIEQTCTNDGLKTAEIICEFGCLSGVCLEQEIDLALCGNGILDAGEQCDDGNSIYGDGCNALCIFEPRDSEGRDTLSGALSAINRWKIGEGNLKEALNAVREWQG